MDDVFASGGATPPSNEKARELALKAVGSMTVEPTSLVAYRSQGRLLIIGEAAQAVALGESLKKRALRCHVLAQGEGIGQVTDEMPVLYINRGLDIQITGHLGRFTVTLLSEEHGKINVAQALEVDCEHFDLILDLSASPLLNWDVPPLGYYASRENATELNRILTELPDMIGEFEKPTFFRYDPDICAHGNSGLKGCTRCLDTCPTGAITSLTDKIAIDPYYCQGGGSCATACPTGAIIYSYPTPADLLERLRYLLRLYRESGGREPVLLFHDGTAGKERLKRLSDRLPGNVIVIEVEEVGSLGMDTWLVALAYGAQGVLILETAQVSPSVHREITEQLSFAHALLAGMGYPTEALRSWQATDSDSTLLAMLETAATMPSIKSAEFAAGNEKRRNLFSAIDHLTIQAPSLTDRMVTLPLNAPFGEIQVDRNACTLCMACVSVCPASALFDGTDTPQLAFLEANCVQCGLCERACPEDAITLQSRFLFDPQQRRRRRTLNEEEAFHCIACGKPFATRSMIDKMQSKLAGHWMFQDPAAIKRLQMCGECRVRDMFSG